MLNANVSFDRQKPRNTGCIIKQKEEINKIYRSGPIVLVKYIMFYK